MSVGRRQKADARWLLPLLCRRGHITKREVGAIRIGESETYVQIPRIAAKKFSDALKRSAGDGEDARSEEHTSELQSLMRISYAVFCLKNKKTQLKNTYNKQKTNRMT